MCRNSVVYTNHNKLKLEADFHLFYLGISNSLEIKIMHF